MHFCCICQSSYENEKNLFKEQICDPPVAITDLIHECTQDFVKGEDVINGIKQSYICEKCTGKLQVYYKASLIMKKIKNEFQNLMSKPISTKEEEPSDHGWTPDEEIPILSIEEGEAVIPHEGDGESNDYIKVEYVEYGDSFTDAEDEFILDDDMSVSMKSKMIHTEMKVETESENSSMFADVIEFEEISISDAKETTDVEAPAPKSSTKSQSKTIKKEKITVYECTECDMDFKGKRQFNAHRRDVHFSGYVCDTCGKTFYSHNGFESHKLTHKDVKEFICNVCGQAFSLKVYLKHHMAWHTGEMNYQCDICEKRFVHKVALQKHKKIHTNIRQITCEICGFKFMTRAHLNRHMSTHTGAKPHSCPICGKCFSQVYNMKVHIREHEKPGSTRRHRVKCNTCAKSFSNKANYEQHCKSNICEYAE